MEQVCPRFRKRDNGDRSIACDGFDTHSNRQSEVGCRYFTSFPSVVVSNEYDEIYVC